MQYYLHILLPTPLAGVEDSKFEYFIFNYKSNSVIAIANAIALLIIIVMNPILDVG